MSAREMSLARALVPILLSLAAASCAPGKRVKLEMTREVVVRPPTIQSVDLEPTGSLDTRDVERTVRVVMRGDPALQASFDVNGLEGGYEGRAMEETRPGIYEGSFTVPKGKTGSVIVTGQLVDPPSQARQEYRTPESLRLFVSSSSPSPSPPLPSAERSKATACTPEVAAAFDQGLKPLVVYFEFDMADLPQRGMALLDGSRAVLSSQPLCKIQIHGHADDVGTPEYNQRLSMRRAGVVAGYLESLGITRGRLETFAHGEDHPADPARSQESGWSNRRVEIRAVNPY